MVKIIHLLYNPLSNLFIFGEGKDQNHLHFRRDLHYYENNGNLEDKLLEDLGSLIDPGRRVLFHISDEVPNKIKQILIETYGPTKVVPYVGNPKK